MMLSPVAPPSSLSAADRPGAMLNTEPPPGGTTTPFVSIVMDSQCSFELPQIPGDFAARIARSGGLDNGKSLHPRSKRRTCVAQVADRGEQLPDARRRELARPGLDRRRPAGHVATWIETGTSHE